MDAERIEELSLAAKRLLRGPRAYRDDTDHNQQSDLQDVADGFLQLRERLAAVERLVGKWSTNRETYYPNANWGPGQHYAAGQKSCAAELEATLKG